MVALPAVPIGPTGRSFAGGVRLLLFSSMSGNAERDGLSSK